MYHTTLSSLNKGQRERWVVPIHKWALCNKDIRGTEGRMSSIFSL